MEKVKEVDGQLLVPCRFKNVVDHFEWAFMRVNGPNEDRECRLL